MRAFSHRAGEQPQIAPSHWPGCVPEVTTASSEAVQRAKAGPGCDSSEQKQAQKAKKSLQFLVVKVDPWRLGFESAPATPATFEGQQERVGFGHKLIQQQASSFIQKF